MTYALHIDSSINKILIIGQDTDQGFKVDLSVTRPLSTTLIPKITHFSYHGSKAPSRDLLTNYFQPLKRAPIEEIAVTYKQPSHEKHRFDYLRELNPISVRSLTINAPVMIKAAELHALIDHFDSQEVTMNTLFSEEAKLKVTLFQLKVDNQCASEGQKTRALVARGILDAAYNLEAERDKPVVTTYFNFSRSPSRSATASPMSSPLGLINEEDESEEAASETASETDSEKSSPVPSTRSRRVAWLSPTSSTRGKAMKFLRNDNSDGKSPVPSTPADNDHSKAQSAFTRTRKIK